MESVFCRVVLWCWRDGGQTCRSMNEQYERMALHIMIKSLFKSDVTVRREREALRQEVEVPAERKTSSPGEKDLVDRCRE